MKDLLSVVFSDFSDYTDRVAADVRRFDSLEMNTGKRVRDDAAKVKAAAYVWLAAALESFVNSTLRETVAAIVKTNVPAKELHPRILCILNASQLKSLGDLRGLNMWLRRAEIMNTVMSNVNVQMGDYELPIDGRTLRRKHFEAIWAIFGFNGPVLPEPHSTFALEDLAEGRNEVAHGRTDPITFGRSKHAKDLETLIQRIEVVGLHLHETCIDYLQTSAYRR